MVLLPIEGRSEEREPSVCTLNPHKRPSEILLGTLKQKSQSFTAGVCYAIDNLSKSLGPKRLNVANRNLDEKRIADRLDIYRESMLGSQAVCFKEQVGNVSIDFPLNAEPHGFIMSQRLKISSRPAVNLV